MPNDQVISEEEIERILEDQAKKLSEENGLSLEDAQATVYLKVAILELDELMFPDNTIDVGLDLDTNAEFADPERAASYHPKPEAGESDQDYGETYSIHPWGLHAGFLRKKGFSASFPHRVFNPDGSVIPGELKEMHSFTPMEEIFGIAFHEVRHRVQHNKKDLRLFGPNSTSQGDGLMAAVIGLTVELTKDRGEESARLVEWLSDPLEFDAFVIDTYALQKDMSGGSLEAFRELLLREAD